MSILHLQSYLMFNECWWTCWMHEWMYVCFHCVFEWLCILACFMFKNFSFMYVHVHGGGFSWMVNVMVASSSSVEGSRTLHRYSNTKCIPLVIVGRSCCLLMVSWSWCMVLDTFFSFWIWIVIHFLINFSNVNDMLTIYQIQNELLYFFMCKFW